MINFLFRIPRIYWILLLALVLRLILFLYIQIYNPDAMWAPDTIASYQKVAMNLLQNHNFSSSDSEPFEPDVRITPGYPLMMAMVYFIFGIRPAFVVIPQIILSVIMVFIVYKLGVVLYNQRAGLLSAFLLAIEPTSVYYSNVLLTETLFSFLLICFIFLSIKTYVRCEKINLNKVLLASFILALATFTRPISYYLTIPISIVFLIYFVKNLDLRKSIILFVSFILVQIIIIGGWQLRNYVKTGCNEVATTGIETLFLCGAADVIALENGISYEEGRKQLTDALYENIGPNSSVAEKYSTEKRMALEIIKGSPLVYAKLKIKGILIMFADPGTTSIMIALGLRESDSGILSKVGFNHLFFEYIFSHKLLLIFNFVGIIYLFIVYIAFVIGVLKTSNRLAFISILLMLGLILYFMLVAHAESYSRYRSPIMPYISLIAGFGLSVIIARKNGKKNRSYL